MIYLKNKKIIGLFVLFLIASNPVFAGDSANSLPSDNPLSSSPGKSVDEATIARNRTVLLILNKIDASEIKSTQFEKGGISYVFNSKGWATKATFLDGYSFDISYELDENGLMKSVSLVHNYIMVKFVLKDSQFIVSNIAPPPPIAQSVPASMANPNPKASMGETSSSRRKIKAPASYVESAPSESAQDNNNHDLVTIIIEQDAESFDQFTRAFSRSYLENDLAVNEIAQTKVSIPVVSGDSNLSSLWTISAIKDTVKAFEHSQKKIMQHYEKSTEIYYDKLATELSRDEILNRKITEAKTKDTSNHSETRKVVDEAVQKIFSDPSYIERRDKWAKRIRSAQPNLYNQYIKKSQNELKNSTETSFQDLVEKLQKVLPVKSQIHIEGDITEIILYLSTLSG